MFALEVNNLFSSPTEDGMVTGKLEVGRLKSAEFQDIAKQTFPS